MDTGGEAIEVDAKFIQKGSFNLDGGNSYRMSIEFLQGECGMGAG